jgi:hypothetical protein
MNDYPPEYDQEILDNQYFVEAFPDADSPWHLYRDVYKYSNCGAHLSVLVNYIEVLEPDGYHDYPHEVERSKWVHSDDLAALATWAEMDQRGMLVTGFLLGSIVEGVDQVTGDYEIEVRQLDEEPQQFAERFYKTLEEVEREAEFIWNQTHGCETCAEHWQIDEYEGCDGVTPVWKSCPSCQGEGISI